MSEGWQYLALMRHGHSHANAAIKKGTDGHYYDITGSDKEIGLDERGVCEANWSAQTIVDGLSAQNITLDELWLSPFLRVTQTADQVVEALGYEPKRVLDDRLAKRSYGVFWNLTYKGVEELYPEEYEKFKTELKLEYRPPEGESYRDLFTRVDGFFDKELVPASGNWLIVTHMVVLLSLQRKLDGLTEEEVLKRYEEMDVPNGYIRIYRRKNKDEAWQFYREYVPDASC